jgi:acetyl-CoA carboxylase beta subunit
MKPLVSSLKKEKKHFGYLFDLLMNKKTIQSTSEILHSPTIKNSVNCCSKCEYYKSISAQMNALKTSFTLYFF